MMRLLGPSLAREDCEWADEASVELILGDVVTQTTDPERPTGVQVRIGADRVESYGAMVSAVGVESNPKVVLGAYVAGDLTGRRMVDGSVVRSETGAALDARWSWWRKCPSEMGTFTGRCEIVCRSATWR